MHVVTTTPLGPHQMLVIVEGDSVAAVTSARAREIAQDAVVGKLDRPGLSSSTGPYPVGPQGTYEAIINGDNEPVAAYRNDFTYQGAL